MENFNINNFKYADGDFSGLDFIYDIINEGNDSDTFMNQSIIFECGDDELIVNFETYFSGEIVGTSGDWYTPDDFEIKINEFEIEIIDVKLNNVDFDYSKYVKEITKMIKNELQ